MGRMGELIFQSEVRVIESMKQGGNRQQGQKTRQLGKNSHA